MNMITPPSDYDSMMAGWLYVALITTLVLIQYLAVTAKVGWAREKYGVKAPATTGHPDFERCYRVQMNTLEQLVVFLPALWMFAGFWNSPKLAALLGLGWLVGRVLYAMGYYKASEKRALGFGISIFCTVILLLGSLVGVVKAMF
jgi:glutathione S-transferase